MKADAQSFAPHPQVGGNQPRQGDVVNNKGDIPQQINKNIGQYGRIAVRLSCVIPSTTTTMVRRGWVDAIALILNKIAIIDMYMRCAICSR